MPIANVIRVAIIGGGFSGLSAARHLLSHQAGDSIFEVTVFEARDRLGGRAFTSNDIGVPVDLGSSWIHGIDENPIYKLAQDYNLPVSGDTLQNKAFFDPVTGQQVNDEDVAHSRAIYEKIHNAAKFFGTATDDFAIPLENTFFTYLNNYRKELYEGLPVPTVPVDPEANTTQTDESRTPTENELRRATRERAVTFFLLLEQLITAARLNEISSLGWSKYKEYEGPQVMFSNGYSSVVQALSSTVFGSSSANFSNPPSRTAQLHISTPVTNINYENPDKITVTTKQGNTYDFEHVISTLPLGVMKAKQVQFQPPLLLFKQTAINNLGFGVLEKIALRFKTQFWTTNVISCLPTTEFGNEFLSFVSLHDVIGEPVLLAFVQGQFAKILQRMDIKKVQELVMKRLREIFPQAEDPTHITMSKWHEDPYTRGSYSYPAVGGVYRDIVNYAEPIQTRFGIPRVMFAGEATDVTYYGTTHAAFLSGEREAKRLIDCLTKPQQPSSDNV